MVVFKFEMTNDDTTTETTTGAAVSPGLPEAEHAEDEECSLPDEVFDALEFNLSPLIKEEIRTTIRNKRFGSGMEELVIDDSPKEPSSLTPEEEERRRVRRENNRVAAIKCRNKRREAAKALEDEWEKQQSLQRKLQEEVDKLEAEKQKLTGMMQAHRPSCILRTKDAMSSQNMDSR